MAFYNTGITSKGYEFNRQLCHPSLAGSQRLSVRLRTNRGARTSQTRHTTGSIKCSVHVNSEKDYDVVVIGAGISGATFARELVPKGYNVLLVDAGAQTGKRPGW